jgi:integrase/recombinase XerD
MAGGSFMKNACFLSTLADRLSQYVEFQRLGGVDAGNQAELLGFFDRFLHKEGFEGRWPTRDAVERYVESTKHLHPGSRSNRLSVVRQFARYLRQFEPQAYVAPTRLPLERRPLRVPHIYSESEIKALLGASAELPPSGSLRPKTYYTFFGLLYTTGLRCGEACGLNLADVNLGQKLLYVRRGKFGKSRWVPISASSAVALERYIQERSRAASSAPEDPVFITRGGRRVYHTNADLAFRQALRRCGLRGGKGCPGPRLHDLRHSFACMRILSWYREGKDVNPLLPALATYLGHVKVTFTQRYLHATAELLAEANDRFLKNFRKNILKVTEEP